MSESVEQLWNRLPESERQTINILNKVQAQKGFIPRDILIELAERAGLPESQIYGMVSFFNSYRLCPVGQHRIQICYGTACYARGASLINDRLMEMLNLDGNDTSPDGLITVEQVFCVGACSLAPVIIQNEVIKSRMKSYQVPLLVNELRKTNE